MVTPLAERLARAPGPIVADELVGNDLHRERVDPTKPRQGVDRRGLHLDAEHSIRGEPPDFGARLTVGRIGRPDAPATVGQASRVEPTAESLDEARRGARRL